jgi:ABC-type multidrug transport system ATPase subunit
VNALASAQRVSVRFGAFTAVDSVSLSVESGEVVGLLGANGAGKTTLIRALLGLLRPVSGQALLFGSVPSVKTRRRVGYVPQTLGLYDDMTVQENWSFTSGAFGTGQPKLPGSIAVTRDELVGSLPLGTQRRVALAVAFSHQPDLLVLDEPTSGVAPLSAARLWQDIRASAEQGTGVLVTTHNMEEAEQCDRLVVMAGGRVAAAGTVDDIIGARKVAEIRCDDWRKAFGLLDAAGYVVQAHGQILRVAASLHAVERLLSSDHIQAMITLVPANLEEAFAAIASQVPGRET